ncbi:hypothetical protein Csa_007251 [Cucumis sativus]|uniref:Uncharacterized protein n=1 Tax=Cucumis sativus TaxID=3659 RepID=A0A0A0LZP6_CUCSA|nr:hypothetical protein Csa_007251 [Cucumis sativus]
MKGEPNGKKQSRKYFKSNELAHIRDSQINVKRNHPIMESPPIFDISDQLEFRMVKVYRNGASFFLNKKKIVAIKPVNLFLNPNLESPITELTRLLVQLIVFRKNLKFEYTNKSFIGNKNIYV